MLPAWIPASWTMCCRWIWDTRLTALFPGLPRWAGTSKVKPIWILLKQETVSGSSISWAICKSAPSFRQITMPTPHHSVFYRPDALPAAQPTASKHWRQEHAINIQISNKTNTSVSPILTQARKLLLTESHAAHANNTTVHKAVKEVANFLRAEHEV